MSAKHQKFVLRIPPTYDDRERLAIGQAAIEHIQDRTEKGVDKNGKPFPKYTTEYKNSVAFRVAGKSAGSIDLRLSGDMMTALEVLETAPGRITIGYRNGSEENAKADGNIRGTYGQDTPNAKKARDFLGLTDAERERILNEFPRGGLESETRLRVTEAVLAALRGRV